MIYPTPCRYLLSLLALLLLSTTLSAQQANDAKPTRREYGEG